MQIVHVGCELDPGGSRGTVDELEVAASGFPAIRAAAAACRQSRASALFCRVRNVASETFCSVLATEVGTAAA